MPRIPGRASRSKPRRLRCLEALEDRSLPSGFAAGAPLLIVPVGPALSGPQPPGHHWDFNSPQTSPLSLAGTSAAFTNPAWPAAPENGGTGGPRPLWAGRAQPASESLIYLPSGSTSVAYVRASLSQADALRFDGQGGDPIRAEVLATLAVDHLLHQESVLTSTSIDSTPLADSSSPSDMISSALAQASTTMARSDVPMSPSGGDPGSHGEPGAPPIDHASLLAAAYRGLAGDPNHVDASSSAPPHGGPPGPAPAGTSTSTSTALNGTTPGVVAGVAPTIAATQATGSDASGHSRPGMPNLGPTTENGPTVAIAPPGGVSASGSASASASGDVGPVQTVAWTLQANRDASASRNGEAGEALTDDSSEAQGPVNTILTSALPIGAAELIASFSPFERGTLERSIDQFLGRIVALDTELSELGDTATLIPNVVTAAVAVFVAETVRRRLRRPWEDEEASSDASGDHFAFPGLPGRSGRWALEDR